MNILHGSYYWIHVKQHIIHCVIFALKSIWYHLWIWLCQKTCVCQLRLPSLYDFEISGMVNTKLSYSGLILCKLINFFWIHYTHKQSERLQVEHALHISVLVPHTRSFRYDVSFRIWAPKYNFCPLLRVSTLTKASNVLLTFRWCATLA
jgi:hypothetical protein